MFKIGFGQDSHAFEDLGDGSLMLGGVVVKHPKNLKGNSDSDVVLHALTNAISSITTVNILGERADSLLKAGKYQSRFYVIEALKYWDKRYRITHIAISIECLVPILADYLDLMRECIADLCMISSQDVGITATTGENLTAFGRGEGIQASVIISAYLQ